MRTGLATVVDLLVCPHCAQGLELEPDGRSVRCGRGHVFDVARQGYLNLLGAKAPKSADTAAMVGARDRFLSAGHYAPIAERLLELAVRGSPSRLLEVGAGTGYYLAGLLDGLPEARGVALDVSVAAARRAARAHPGLGSVVADAWRTIPISASSIDLVLNVFAPRNAAEFARLLATGGSLLVVTPEQDHLAELRSALKLLDVQPAKHDQLQSGLGASFVEESAETLQYGVVADTSTLTDLVAMGPNAFHLTGPEIRGLVQAVPIARSVTVSVNLSVWSVPSGPAHRATGAA